MADKEDNLLGFWKGLDAVVGISTGMFHSFLYRYVMYRLIFVLWSCSMWLWRILISVDTWRSKVWPKWVFLTNNLPLTQQDTWRCHGLGYLDPPTWVWGLIPSTRLCCVVDTCRFERVTKQVTEFMGIIPNGYVGQCVDFIIFVLDLRWPPYQWMFANYVWLPVTS